MAFFVVFCGMKKIAALLLFLSLGTYSQSQSIIQWGPEVVVTNGSIYGNLRPRATIVGSDTPVVIFGKAGADENLFIARWNGSTFDPPIPILPSATSSYIADWTGPDIDSHGDTVIAVFKLNPLETGHVYTVRSTDGGVTFSDTIRTDSHPSGVAWMPSMGMQPNGNPVVTYMAHDGIWSNPRYVITNSSDGGLSYEPEMEVTGAIAGEACDCCPAEIIIEGPKQVLQFRNNESNLRDLHGVLSIDGGATYTSYANIDNLNWTLQACPATGADGVFYGDTLITAYASAASGKYRVYVSSSSTNGTIVFEERMMVPEPTPANGTQNYPRISAAGDTIVMAWTEKINGNQEIYCAASVLGMNPMTSLTGYKEMANASSTGTQTNAEIIYKNGFVHLFYQNDAVGDLIYRRGTLNVNVGLDEKENSVRPHPNPSSDGSFILSDKVEILDVKNALGKSISYNRTDANGQLIVKINHPSSGIYFLSYLGSDFQSKVIKLIVN